MKVYTGENIRNLAVVGHSHTGKTSLVSAMLYTAGATPKQGRVDDGSTVTDYDEEETARLMTITNGVCFAEFGGSKINFIDTPGFNMFVHEAKAAMLPVEAAIVVVDGAHGVEVMTERVWLFAEEYELPRIIAVNRMDRDHADGAATTESLIAAFGRQVVPVQIPIGKEKELKGVVDLVHMKAWTVELGGNGKAREIPIPADLADAAKKGHEAIVELVAEGNDALMEIFFDKGTIPDEDLVRGLRAAIVQHKIFPILFTSGLGNLGAEQLLQFIVDFAPAVTDHPVVRAANALPDAHDEHAERHLQDNEPVSLFVFKTVNDPFAGRITFFKVFSGLLRNDAAMVNFTRQTAEKLSHLSVIQGKNSVGVPELHAGDIGAVAKLKSTLTGDTLGDKAHDIVYPFIALAEPAITFAIEPKTRAD